MAENWEEIFERRRRKKAMKSIDIVRRLRLPQNTDENCSFEMAKLCNDAANEIERLQHFEQYYDARMMYQSDFEAKWGEKGR